jgi:hypothetical protein
MTGRVSEFCNLTLRMMHATIFSKFKLRDGCALGQRDAPSMQRGSEFR